MERPYLQPVYDEPEFVVRTVWRLYGGWWDGNPATLKPAPERALAVELADLAGGAGVLADRALALLAARGDDADPDAACAWPGTWPSWPGWPPPTTRPSESAAGTVFSPRADQASSTMAHGVFSWAARES